MADLNIGLPFCIKINEVIHDEQLQIPQDRILRLI